MSNIQSLTALANATGYDTSFTSEFSVDQTNNTIITPTSGTRLEIKGVYIATTATTGEARLIIADSTGTDTVVDFFANSQAGYIPLIIKGNRNAPLKITSTYGADKNYFVLVNYREA